MILVERSEVSKPKIFESEKAKNAAQEALAYYKQPAEKRAQEKFKFLTEIYVNDEVKSALRELFSNKCAYCESKLEEDAFFVIDHFRPMSSSMGLKGDISPEHYFWLAYEWENLYPSCETCSISKGSRFPISAAQRADIGTLGEDLLDEKPMLLDPCWDYPEDHLVFNESGLIASDTDRGKITIEVFGLNRPQLVEARKGAHDGLIVELAAIEEILASGEELPRSYYPDRLADGSQLFAGVRRQFLAQWLQYPPEKVKAAMEDPQMDKFAKLVEEYRDLLKGRSRRERDQASKEYQQFQQAQDDYTLDKQPKKTGYYLRTRLIEKIEIRNFKPIKELDISIPPANELRTPWLMILGENGTGKSSILQAVTLTLAGEKYRASFGIRPDDVLRHGATSGSVKVYLTNTPEPIQLYFNKGKQSFEGYPPEPKILLLAYGATRLLPRVTQRAAKGRTYAHIENLFNPFVPLQDASKWLCEQSDESFDNIARAIKVLLSLNPEDQLVRECKGEPQVFLQGADGNRVALTDLSDGYQTILALTVDIMAVMTARWEIMEVAEGIVLVDEIGAHLHPRWKMQIVKSLRDAFPRIQFITSTHNPLCLRGMGNAEIIVMRRDQQGAIQPVTDLPAVEGLRVDQLLTSEYFGLNSVIDPGVDALFQEYYKLLTVEKKSQTEKERIETLRASLEVAKKMGETRRESLMFEYIDEFLAKKPETLAPEARKKLDEKTRRNVKKIWEDLELSQD
jgi:uncharacterized protein (TIGR02646 family)